METLIGIDAHSNRCRIVVYNKNMSLILDKYIKTSQQELINFMLSIPKTKVVIFEESDLSSWLKRILYPYVNKIVVADPKENAWISKADIKNDKLDAHKLVKLYNAGLIKEVYHTVDENRMFFKELVLHYHDITRQVTRFKNKIKGEYRQKLILCKGSSVYNATKRNEWLGKLPHSIPRFQVNNYCDVLDTLQRTKDTILRKMHKLSKSYSIIKHFQAIPGVGLIWACTIFSIIDTPHRFSKKSKLWAYAHLGKGEHKSDKTEYSKPAKNGNRLLKYALKETVLNAIKRPNLYQKRYFSMLMNNVSPKLAKKIIARSILTTMWSVWKSGKKYDPEYNNAKLSTLAYI